MKPRTRVELLPDPKRSPVTLDGPLSSIQSALLTVEPRTLDRLLQPDYLQRAADGYWRHLGRLSLRALRLVEGPSSRSVVFIFPGLELLRFRAPRFETQPRQGSVTWPIDRGVLVARRGRGRGELRIEVVRSEPDRATVSAKVSNFYPWLRGSGWFARLGRFIYAQTQLRIHVFVSKGFLRSLGDYLPPSA
jgi:hypothetical protein